MTLARAEMILRSLQSQGVIEILILSGEVHPKSDRRSLWFKRIYNLCELALNLGFLPHTNAGPLTFEEMAQLKTVNASMGLMLEQMTPALLQTVHRHAPSKVPALRLEQLEQAGKLQIPFTTGLLLGLGETDADWVETLETIAQVHARWGHIQEVILQPHSPGQSQAWQGEPFAIERLVELVAIARSLLPNDIVLQIPPNLVPDALQLVACLNAGASDLGGISSKDEVNPDFPHPRDENLAAQLQNFGWQLQPRLPIYPQYDQWLPEQLRVRVADWRLRLAALPSHIVHPGTGAASEIRGADHRS
jgi:7,8-didemethyl-8-hydroxy-5-deazariboflavin synthase